MPTLYAALVVAVNLTLDSGNGVRDRLARRPSRRPAHRRLTTQADKYQLVDRSRVAGEAGRVRRRDARRAPLLRLHPVVAAGRARRDRGHDPTLRLNTGVTLLPTLDPVRVAEDFTTLDVMSGGRAEVTVGRGILPSAYEAVGKPIDASRAIFAESAELLLHLLPRRRSPGGRWRRRSTDVTIEPRSVQRPHLPVWIGGGSSAASVDLAADSAPGLMLPGVFAPAEMFVPFADRYRERFAAAGHDPAGHPRRQRVPRPRRGDVAGGPAAMGAVLPQLPRVRRRRCGTARRCSTARSARSRPSTTTA